MLAVLIIVRRIGEYAFVRPGREMLFAPPDAESKYKAKGFIDTIVCWARDALSSWYLGRQADKLNKHTPPEVRDRGSAVLAG